MVLPQRRRMCAPTGSIFDRAGNLFVLNNSADTALWALRPDGTWKGLYQKELDNAPTLEKTMIDRDGRLWVTSASHRDEPQRGLPLSGL